MLRPETSSATWRRFSTPADGRATAPTARSVALLRALLGSAVAATLAACSHLPDGGPNHHTIRSEATAGIELERRSVVTDYVLLDVSQPVLDSTLMVGPGSFHKSFGLGRGGPPRTRIGLGDTLIVSIFESSTGGLFSSGEAGQRPGNYVTLPTQAVDSSGTIAVPYAGQVRAVGRTPEEIRRDIEARLAKRAIEPQVVVAIAEQASADVSMFGDALAGTFKSRVRTGGERILELIARAGLRVPGHEAFISLQRGDQRATVFFPTLLNTPSENIYVKPGDIVYAYRDPQRFVAVGALGTTGQTQGVTGQFTFDSERLSLVEAIAKAGGLLDTRASASHVFVYRLEYRHVLEKTGVSLAAFPPDMKLIPTIYRANYRDPSVFFFAEKFPMRHKDVIYVSNADAVELDKFFSYIRLYTGTAAGISTDILATRDALRALGR